MARPSLLKTGALPAKLRQRRRRARKRMEALMSITRADVALAEARSLIETRARWPAAPLIGAGARWLRPGTIAGMADELAETDSAMGRVREAIRPMGVLDAVGILEQYADFVAARAAELEALGQIRGRARAPGRNRHAGRCGVAEAAAAIRGHRARPCEGRAPAGAGLG